MKKLIIFLLIIAATLLAQTPNKIQGIYVSWWTMNYPARLQNLATEAKKYGINTMVCDYREPKQTYLDSYKLLKQNGYYNIARIVVFEEGVGADYKSAQDSDNWNKKIKLIKSAEKLGFDEIQLDYIRFADSGSADPKKQEIVQKFLKEAKAAVAIPIGADVFGSVAYQPHRLIGQDMKAMCEVIDMISPMLYPSHYLKDHKRMGNPYETILEGSILAKNKASASGRPVRVAPYIQGFTMSMSYSGLSLKDYIKEQLNAVEDAGTDGYFVWHAGNDYRVTWEALAEHGPMYARNAKTYSEIKQALQIFDIPPPGIASVNTVSGQKDFAQKSAEVNTANLVQPKTISPNTVIIKIEPKVPKTEEKKSSILSILTFGVFK